MRKVAVTGLSLVSPLGIDLESSWKAAVEGRSGVGRIRNFDASGLEVGIAAEIPPLADSLEQKYVPKRWTRQMTRITRLSFAAGMSAAECAGISKWSIDPDRLGVVFGATGTGYRIDDQMADLKSEEGFRILKSMPHAAPAFLSIALGARGPSFTLSIACSSSALAVSQGIDMIRAGRVDVVLAGGGDSSINPEDIRGFAGIMALSTRGCPPEEASCPFDRRRDGFVIGEGAAFLVLEDYARAKSRGARIFAVASGSAVTSEAYNILSPEKGGEGMARTMAAALLDAGIGPAEIDYINAHGTSTKLNDPLETAAIKRVFGPRAGGIAVSSTKSMTGHTLAAAGAVEAVLTVMAVAEGVAPPTINCSEADPECDLDYVPGKARNIPIRSAISNSFAFGGQNVTLVFSAPQPPSNSRSK